jgi:hypothetical protein
MRDAWQLFRPTRVMARCCGRMTVIVWHASKMPAVTTRVCASPVSAC